MLSKRNSCHLHSGKSPEVCGPCSSLFDSMPEIARRGSHMLRHRVCSVKSKRSTLDKCSLLKMEVQSPGMNILVEWAKPHSKWPFCEKHPPKEVLSRPVWRALRSNTSSCLAAHAAWVSRHLCQPPQPAVLRCFSLLCVDLNSTADRCQK